MNFQKIVLLVAIIILIISLTFVGFSIYNSNHNVEFPPIKSKCPDSWDVSGNLCVNTRHLGSCAKGENNTMNFNLPYYKGKEGKCRKYKWAERCGVSWPGITYEACNH